MIEVDATLRKWGNSMGVIVPLSKIKEDNLIEGEEVTVLLIKKDNFLDKIFGAHKFKKSVEQMMKETDEELYND